MLIDLDQFLKLSFDPFFIGLKTEQLTTPITLNFFIFMNFNKLLICTFRLINFSNINITF